MKTIRNSGFAAIITAAGTSRRMKMGVKKEYLSLSDYREGATVISECLFKFLKTKLFKTIVITLPKKDILTSNNLIFADTRIENTLSETQTEVVFISGGNTRQASVFAALKKLAELKEEYLNDFKYVLIHDGARPWVSCELIKNICAAVKKYGAAIPGYQAIDTQKIIDESGKITNHLKRSTTYSIQTPQGFNFEKILSAHKTALNNGKEYTDDSEIYSEFAEDVFICKGEISNKKITFAEDIK